MSIGLSEKIYFFQTLSFLLHNYNKLYTYSGDICLSLETKYYNVEKYNLRQLYIGERKKGIV